VNVAKERAEQTKQRTVENSEIDSLIQKAGIKTLE
jgi:hypothetical protein